MPLKLYLFSLFFILALSIFLCFLLIFNVNPYQAPFWIVGVFYLTVFSIWASVFAIFSYYMKVWRGNHELIFAHIGSSLRHAIFLSLIVTVCLFLRQIQVLNWWIAGMLILSISIIELIFKSKKTLMRRIR